MFNYLVLTNEGWMPITATCMFRAIQLTVDLGYTVEDIIYGKESENEQYG